MAKKPVKTATKVVESQRSKRLSKLETIEEVQKDIQTIYGEAKKINAKSDKALEQYTINSLTNNIAHFVAETKNISRLTKAQVEKFWHSAYTKLEGIIELSQY